MERLMLLDANGIIYRAYFALLNTPLTTSRGELVNAVFGFWSIVLRGFQDVKPDYVIAAFDVGRPTVRLAEFAEYKATRRSMPDDLREQFPKVRQLIEAFGIPIREIEGHEADDVIGTLARQAEEQGLQTTIVSGDLDMLQLVTPQVNVMTTRGGVQQTVIYDPDKIVERYGLTAAQMIDFKALKGDTTDNIPGIPGVGEKTAAKLLQDHGTVIEMYEKLDAVQPEKLRLKLADHREQVLRSRQLVTIKCDLPVPLELEPARLGEYDRAEVMRLFREYEFRSLVERLPTLTGEARPEPGELLRQADRTGPVPAALVPGREPGTRGRTIIGEGSGLQLSLDFATLSAGGDGADGETPPVSPAAGDQASADGVAEGARGVPVETDAASAVPTQDARGRLAAALADPTTVERWDGTDITGWLRAQPEVAVGIALDDPRPRRGSLLGFAVAGRDGRTITADATLATTLLETVMAARRPLVGHEAKQALVAELDRIDPVGTHAATEVSLPPVAFDTQVAAYILNAALRSQSLADIVVERLELEYPRPGELGGADHAAVQALAVAAARDVLGPALEQEGLDRLYRELELPLIEVLAGMEATGVKIDRDALGGLGRVFAEEIARLETEIFESVGHQFSLGSPKQLEQVLFYELQLPRGKRTKTGYSTDASVLEDLRPAHPMVDKLLDWRVYTKLKSTYVDTLPTLIDPDTDRLHTTFGQAVASTGRLSSSDPNLQNIPIRTELGRSIRRTFVAGGPDLTLLAADFSQIELRILAHVSGDVHLREAFERGEDIHRATAARVLHKEPEKVTASERSMAKMVNFGLAYGMSDFGLASRANIPRAEAHDFINSYFAAYSGISYYMMHIKEVAKERGFVTTLLGRRRWIPELTARNPSLRGAGERMAINMPIQGTAADIMKLATIRVADVLRRRQSRARMLLTVHDELLFEVPRDEVDAVAPVIRDAMEGAMTLDVPLTVELKMGPDWDSMTPLPRTPVEPVHA